MAKPHVVTMLDFPMSGWGPCQGKLNVLLIVCPTWEDARRAYNYAIHRSDFGEVRITEDMPKKYMDESKYFVSIKQLEHMSDHWKLESESDVIEYLKKRGEM